MAAKTPKLLLAVLVVFAVGCATAPVVTSPVYPFGPDTYTTSASTAVELPNRVREEVVMIASTFCETQGERSLPIDINLISAPSSFSSSTATHSATMVFRCFDPGTQDETEGQI